MGILNILKYKYKKYKDEKKLSSDFDKRHEEKVKEQIKLRKEIEKEYKEELKKEKEEKYKDLSRKEVFKKEALEIIEDVLNHDDFAELKEVMTENEIKEYEERKKREKRFTIGAIVTISSIMIVAFVGLLIFGEIIKSDLEKVTQPILEDYYIKTIGDNAKVDKISYLDEDKHIALATFTSGINVMCIDNDYIGNDSTYESLYNEYKTLLLNTINGTHMIINKPKLIYRPYLVEYNYYIDYIDTLPSNIPFNTMLNEGKLDIVDIIIYEGDINKNNVLNMLSRFGDNSVIYLVKMSSQNVLNLTIVNKAEIKSYDVFETKYTGNSDIAYLFDSNINKIGSIDVALGSPTYDRTNQYYFTNIKTISVRESYLRDINRDEDTRTKYFMLKLNKEDNYDDFVVLDRSNEEAKLNKYPNVMTIKSSTGLIVIGDKAMTIANKEKKSNSFLCRFNLC